MDTTTERESLKDFAARIGLTYTKTLLSTEKKNEGSSREIRAHMATYHAVEKSTRELRSFLGEHFHAALHDVEGL